MRRALVLWLALAWIAAPGCNQPQDGQPETAGAGAAGDRTGAPAADDAPVRGGTLVVAMRGDVDGFNPVVARSSLTGDLLMRMFPVLARPTFDCRLVFGPGLARSWSLDESGTALTLELRDDLRWQDGQPVDVDDVLWTLGAVRDPRYGSPRGPLLDVLRDADPWTRAGDHELVLHLREPAPLADVLASVGATPIAPEHALRDADPATLRGGAFDTEPVASGPFWLDRWERGQRVVLRRADDAPASGPPYLDRVELRVIPDDTARLLAFERGEVDLVLGVEADQLARIAASRADARVLKRGRRFLDAIGWNQLDARLADERVRTALALAADVDRLIAALLTVDGQAYGTRATGTITPELCDMVPADLEPLPHDPAGARALLADAGWADGDGDGTLDRDGAPLRIELLYAAGNTRREQAAVILQQQLAEVGVALAPVPVERGALLERLRNRDFEAALFGWSASLVVDPTPMWHSGERGAFNVVGFADDEVDALIDRGRHAADAADAALAWQQMQRRIYAAQPYLFLYWIDEMELLDTRVRGAEVSTVGVFEGLERWWIPADARRYPAVSPAP